MKRLENVVQPYAWGSRTAIAQLMGRPPSQVPEAELWMGTHPGGHSQVLGEQGPQPLGEHIRENPVAHLGAASVARFGAELPFLLKILAAETPLSLQTHPSLAQAKEGFAREEALGIPRNAPHRNYKDANHKPELICALTPFQALCGFRDPARTLALFQSLTLESLRPLLEPLERSVDAAGVRAMFERLMTMPREECRPLVDAVAQAGERLGGELRWGATLAALYPGDPGVIGALMLNQVHLQPGEAVYLPAGNLHAYLAGVGVEIMASSDNVLRGGCTPKYVDPPELLRVLEFWCGDVPVLRAEPLPDGEAVYRTPTDEFRLSRLALRSAAPVTLARRGAEILLVTEGEVTLRLAVEAVTLSSGQSVYVSAADPAYRLAGTGTLFRATAGDAFATAGAGR